MMGDVDFPTYPTSFSEGSHVGGRRPQWTSSELEEMWRHPDWTADELSELIPRHSPAAIQKCRERQGRWHDDVAPLCRACGERPVWEESPHARRLGLCKGCYVEEETLRLKDEAANVALRKRRERERRSAGGD